MDDGTLCVSQDGTGIFNIFIFCHQILIVKSNLLSISTLQFQKR